MAGKVSSSVSTAYAGEGEGGGEEERNLKEAKVEC